MFYTLKFLPDGREAKAAGENSILETAIANGIHINSSCNGLGKCGKCKVIVKKGRFRTESTELLTEEEKKKGYLLACQTFPEEDLEVFIPPESRLGEHQILEKLDSGIAEMLRKSKSAGDLGLAVDIGTTTVVAYLVDLDSKDIIDIESQLNKQGVFGADVLSRINHAKEDGGLEKLNSLIIENINELTEILLDKNFFGDSKKHRINRIVTAGNTVMTYLLLRRDPSPIQKNEQLEEFRQSNLAKASELGIDCGNPAAEVYSMPGIATYVGGDIVADILASGMHKSEKISMLIDVGTNGEIALGNKDFLVTCSTSAGPAFEGGETKHGMKASTGAIERVEIGDGEIRYAVINNDRPRGICGSGLIDLISELLLNEIIDHRGKFLHDSEFSNRTKTGEFGSEFVVVPKEESSIDSDIVITEKDIENIIITKAAIYAGASTLTKVGTSFDQLDKIYITGGFGHYINVDKAIVLGLLPDLPEERFKFIGNGSVLGAHLCLTDSEKRKEAGEIAKKATYLDLSKDRSFTEEYMNASYLPHNNMNLFPSVE